MKSIPGVMPLKFQSPVIDVRKSVPAASINNPISRVSATDVASKHDEFHLIGAMRQTALLSRDRPIIPTPIPIPEAEPPTAEPVDPIPTATPTTVPTAASTNVPAAATLTLEETKSISDIAYDGAVGEVYQLPDGSCWRVDQTESDPSGFRAVVMRRVIPNPDGSGGYVDDPTDNRVVVGFAGTDALDDVDDDLAQGIGFTPEQYDQAVAFTNEVQQEATVNNETVVLTGHSLGGGLATYAAIETGVPATVINSAPLDNGKVPDDVSYDEQITQYYADGEILTDLDNANPFDSRPGNHVEIDGSFDEVSLLDGVSWRNWRGAVGRIAENVALNVKISIDNHSLGNTAPEIPPPVRVYP